MAQQTKEKKIGLALSGGGVRGFAHLGVLQALEEVGIRAEIVSGTSAGSIVGALYCAGYDSSFIMQTLKETSLFRLLQFKVPTGGFTNLQYLEEKLLKLIPHDEIELLTIPLKITVSNLTKGEAEVKTQGSLSKYVIASSSIPLVFAPIVEDENVYTDGGLFQNFPCSSIREECSLLIGSNVMPFSTMKAEELRSIWNIGMRCFDLSIQSNSKKEGELCDVLIQHHGLLNLTLFQVSKAESIKESGYKTAIETLEKYRKLKMIDF